MSLSKSGDALDLVARLHPALTFPPAMTTHQCCSGGCGGCGGYDGSPYKAHMYSIFMLSFFITYSRSKTGELKMSWLYAILKKDKAATATINPNCL